MAKIKDSVWVIFTKSLQLYFSNFGSFFKYMAFPVLGQILGIILSFLVAFLYAENLPKWIVKGGLFDNFSMIFTVLILAIIPGILIFAKAFWDYLVAYGAVNSMVDGLLKSGKVYDFPAHTEMITRKSFKYIGLLLAITFLSLVGLCPLLWVIACIVFVYFILVFQVFVYEPDKSIFGCFQKSMQIIKGNFLRTIGLLFLIGTFTYVILPKTFEFLLGLGDLIVFFSIPFDIWAQQLPIPEINETFMKFHLASNLTSLIIAQGIFLGFVGYIVICFTLPLRTICWALWYKNLNKAESKLDKKILDRAEGKG